MHDASDPDSNAPAPIDVFTNCLLFNCMFYTLIQFKNYINIHQNSNSQLSYSDICFLTSDISALYHISFSASPTAFKFVKCISEYFLASRMRSEPARNTAFTAFFSDSGLVSA